MNKNEFATTPPMGWNSYDYYDTTVNEAQVRENAEYMAKNLRKYGWEYVVIDISWYCYHVGKDRERYQYLSFEKMEMDEYGRLLPCPDRFPSAVEGKGFRPLADYIHSLGLKFGIHIMRGIPRMAAHTHTKIWGSDVTADEIAGADNICAWNPYMYGILPSRTGGQEYYNSIFNLYSEWGVDFVKCDDICRMDMPTAKEETEMLHKAIRQCGRPIVLSLSPGPAVIEEAWFYEKNANMWRITDDFWDNWQLLKNMFWRCEVWEKHVSEGCYPDCDMLPVGRLGKGFGEERESNFTEEEQRTMITLWSIFRSPMMIGANLPMLDKKTLARLTNEDVLQMLQLQRQARQLKRTEDEAIWMNENEKYCYMALFNLSDEIRTIRVNRDEYEGMERIYKGIELWTKGKIIWTGNILELEILKHDVKIIRFEK